MFDELRRGDTGPWRCKRCGTRFHAPLMFCPGCGANQLAPPPDAAADAPDAPQAPDAHAMPDMPTHGFADRLRALCNASAANPATATHYGDDYPPVAYDPIDEDHPLPRSRRRLYAGGALAAGVFAFAAYLMLSGGDSGPSRGAQIVEGVVSGLHEVPLGFYRASPQQAAGNTSQHASQQATQQAALQPQDTHANDVRAPKANAGGRTDVSRQLAIARSNLGRNSLWPARRAVANALAAQPGNDDAQRIRAELAARERERDALLLYARQCAHSGQWNCVRQYAGQAQSVDRSSREARRLLLRATVASSAVRPGVAPGPEARPRAAPAVVAAEDSSPDVLERVRRWFEEHASRRTPVKRYPPQLQSWDHP
jgi:hypothetical protein